jgi:hypothetical protein
MTREPGDLPPRSHARAQQAGCCRTGRTKPRSDEGPAAAVRDDELLPRVSSCPFPLVVTQIDLGRGLRRARRKTPRRRRRLIPSSSTPRGSTAPTTSRAWRRLSVSASGKPAICSMSAPAAGSWDMPCGRQTAAGPRSSPRRACERGLRASRTRLSSSPAVGCRRHTHRHGCASAVNRIRAGARKHVGGRRRRKLRDKLAAGLGIEPGISPKISWRLPDYGIGALNRYASATHQDP